MKNLLVDNKRADHPINNSGSFQEGRTAQDTCMNRRKVLGIVLYLDHALRIKKRKTSLANNWEDNESTGIGWSILYVLCKNLMSDSGQLPNEGCYPISFFIARSCPSRAKPIPPSHSPRWDLIQGRIFSVSKSDRHYPFTKSALWDRGDVGFSVLLMKATHRPCYTRRWEHWGGCQAP